MITIKRYDACMAQQWDEFCLEAKNATLLHMRNYMDYHSDRFEDYSLVALAESGKIVALLAASRTGNVVTSHGGLTFGGWIMPLKHFDVTDMMDVTDAAIAFMRADGVKQLIYKPVPHIYHRYPAEEDLYALFRHGAVLTSSNVSSAIPLSNPLRPDRGSLSAINSALRSGVTVGESDDFATFWQILTALLAEKYGTMPVHTLNEIILLKQRLGENIMLMVAREGDDIVAGTVLYLSATVAHCQYIATTRRGRELKALPLLMSRAINLCTDRGLRWFDMGTSNEQGGHVLNEGLVQQKSRLGGRAVVYNTYTINI